MKLVNAAAITLPGLCSPPRSSTARFTPAICPIYGRLLGGGGSPASIFCAFYVEEAADAQ